MKKNLRKTSMKTYSVEIYVTEKQNDPKLIPLLKTMTVSVMASNDDRYYLFKLKHYWKHVTSTQLILASTIKQTAPIDAETAATTAKNGFALAAAPIPVGMVNAYAPDQHPFSAILNFDGLEDFSMILFSLSTFCSNSRNLLFCNSISLFFLFSAFSSGENPGFLDNIRINSFFSVWKLFLKALNSFIQEPNSKFSQEKNDEPLEKPNRHLIICNRKEPK